MKPLTPASPHAIIMIGIPGSGKSTFADRFADTFKAPIVSQTRLQRELDLTDDEARQLRDFILSEYMKTHRTVLIDGGLDNKEQRDETVLRLVKAGYRPLIVWVQTDTGESLRRASKPFPKGSGLTPEAFDALVDAFDPPHAKEKTVVISGKHTYTAQLKIILRQLATPDHTQPKLAPNPKDRRARPVPKRNLLG